MNTEQISEGKLIDITAPVRRGMVHWPGDPEVKIERISDISKGDKANVTVLSMSAHTATHCDAPKHFIENGDDVSHLDLFPFMGPARVIEIRNETEITKEELLGCQIGEHERLLFKTNNSERNWPEEGFMEDYVALSPEAARYLVEKKVLAIGVDYLSVAGRQNGEEVHQLLLGSGVTVIEGLYMPFVTPGSYELVSLPIKIEGSDGSPVRAVLRKIT